MAAMSASPVSCPLRRRYSSAATTTTSSRPWTVTCCGPSLCTLRTSSLKRALASCSTQYPVRGFAERAFADFAALERDLRILVILTSLLPSLG